MKKAILFAFLMFNLTCIYSQNKEVYTGFVSSSKYDVGYQIGFNFIYKVKSPYRMILGFEHSGLYKEKTVNSESGVLETLGDCSTCVNDYFGGNYSTEHDIKLWSRAVSLNLGIEVHKNLFVLSGVTQYQDIIKINRETVSSTRHTFIDAGLKYLVKLSNTEYLTPTVKFNARSYSIGIGIAFE